MKEIFKGTLERLNQSGLVEFIDRDRGQIDKYEIKPAVKLPCSLIKVNFIKRTTLNQMMQRIECAVIIRVASEILIEQSNLTTPQRLEKALEYYDTVQAIESLFQGLNLGKTDPWECVSTIDEDRNDLNVVRFEFRTGFVKMFD